MIRGWLRPDPKDLVHQKRLVRYFDYAKRNTNLKSTLIDFGIMIKLIEPWLNWKKMPQELISAANVHLSPNLSQYWIVIKIVASKM